MNPSANPLLHRLEGWPIGAAEICSRPVGCIRRPSATAAGRRRRLGSRTDRPGARVYSGTYQVNPARRVGLRPKRLRRRGNRSACGFPVGGRHRPGPSTTVGVGSSSRNRPTFAVVGGWRGSTTVSASWAGRHQPLWWPFQPPIRARRGALLVGGLEKKGGSGWSGRAPGQARGQGRGFPSMTPGRKRCCCSALPCRAIVSGAQQPSVG